jgi:hypothetical protein
VSPLERYVARLKDERAVLQNVLDRLEAEDAASEQTIPGTEQWIKQITVRLAAIDTFLKAVETGP